MKTISITLIQTTLISWFVGFVLMWVVLGNLESDLFDRELLGWLRENSEL